MSINERNLDGLTLRAEVNDGNSNKLKTIKDVVEHAYLWVV